MIRMVVAVIVAIAGVSLLIGCNPMTVALPCEMTIVAVREATLEPGDPLPPDLPVIAGPDDFDRTTTAIVPDSTGTAAIDLELRGDAIARLAVHSAGHIGEYLAISINGTVVAVPVIQGPIADGKLEVTQGGPPGTDMAKEFAGCVR